MPGLPLDAWNISLTDFRKDAPINTHQKIRYDLIDKLLSQIPKRGKGLDYGCGLGDQVYHFSRKFESIIGVDVTPERVKARWHSCWQPSCNVLSLRPIRCTTRAASRKCPAVKR